MATCSMQVGAAAEESGKDECVLTGISHSFQLDTSHKFHKSQCHCHSSSTDQSLSLTKVNKNDIFTKSVNS